MPTALKQWLLFTFSVISTVDITRIWEYPALHPEVIYRRSYKSSTKSSLKLILLQFG